MVDATHAPASLAAAATTVAGPIPLRGIVAAAVTPVTADHQVDLPRLVIHVRWLLANGCDMVSLFGTTGEGPSFPAGARLDALAQVVDAGVPAERLLPGVMATSVAEARQLYAGVAALGCRAALIMAPYFFEADDDGMMAYFESVVTGHAMPNGQDELGFLLYHYPAMSGFGFGHSLIGRMVERFGAQLLGVKDSTGDRPHTLGLIAAFPKLSIFTGCDVDLASVVAAGGAGIIGGVPNVNAALLRRRLEAAPPEAAMLDTQIAALFAAVVAFGGPMPIKTLVARLHDDPQWLRAVPPLLPQPPAHRARLIAGFEAAGYDLAGRDRA